MKRKKQMVGVLAASALVLTPVFAGSTHATETLNTEETSAQETRPPAGAAPETAVSVLEVQQALNAKGFTVTEDGTLDQATYQALAQFQQSQGLQATGEPDPQTLAALGVQGQYGIGGSAAGDRLENDPRDPRRNPCAPAGSRLNTTGIGTVEGTPPGPNTGMSQDLSGSAAAGLGASATGSSATGGANEGDSVARHRRAGDTATAGAVPADSAADMPCPPAGRSGTGGTTGQSAVEGTPPGPSTGTSRDLSGSLAAGIGSAGTGSRAWGADEDTGRSTGSDK